MSEDTIDHKADVKKHVDEAHGEIIDIITSHSKTMNLSVKEEWLFYRRIVNAMFIECYTPAVTHCMTEQVKEGDL